MVASKLLPLKSNTEVWAHLIIELGKNNMVILDASIGVSSLRKQIDIFSLYALIL